MVVRRRLDTYIDIITRVVVALGWIVWAMLSLTLGMFTPFYLAGPFFVVALVFGILAIPLIALLFITGITLLMVALIPKRCLIEHIGERNQIRYECPNIARLIRENIVPLEFLRALKDWEYKFLSQKGVLEWLLNEVLNEVPVSNIHIKAVELLRFKQRFRKQINPRYRRYSKRSSLLALRHYLLEKDDEKERLVPRLFNNESSATCDRLLVSTSVPECQAVSRLPTLKH